MFFYNKINVVITRDYQKILYINNDHLFFFCNFIYITTIIYVKRRKTFYLTNIFDTFLKFFITLFYTTFQK